MTPINFIKIMKYSFYTLIFLCLVSPLVNAQSALTERNTSSNLPLIQANSNSFHSNNYTYSNFGDGTGLTTKEAFKQLLNIMKPQKTNANIPLDTCICTKMMKLKDSYDSLPIPKNPSTFSQYYFNKMGCSLTETRITLLQNTCRNTYNHDNTTRPKYTWTVTSYEALDDAVLSGPNMDSLNLPGNCSCNSVKGINKQTSNYNFNVFPNNFTRIINITSFNHEAIQRIEIIDITGKIIYQELVDQKSKVSINTEKIQSGIYFINLYYLENGELKSQKFKIVKS